MILSGDSESLIVSGFGIFFIAVAPIALFTAYLRHRSGMRPSNAAVAWLLVGVSLIALGCALALAALERTDGIDYPDDGPTALFLFLSSLTAFGLGVVVTPFSFLLWNRKEGSHDHQAAGRGDADLQ